MKTHQAIDRYARDLDPSVRQSVYVGSKAPAELRHQVLTRDYDNPDRLRSIAGKIKQHTLENLDHYLEMAERQFQENGAQVHYAVDADSANETVLRIMQRHGAGTMVKAKTMVSEEIGLSAFLEERGIECIETDLGEFIVQIDQDHPSHIIKPIIHKNRRDIARSFEREGLGEYNDDPETITSRARKFLRHKYLEADVGVTGANFVVAESGRIAIVTNEGNARFCMAATPLHIALVGIEKLIPRDRDLALFLSLIARSATGQQISVYNQLIAGPRLAGRPDGPEEMHVVFVDNGRTRILASDCREILRCIRCGACLNICPVYRQASGFAYRSVYPGPVGAVLSPLLAGDKFPEFADLPKASSLCGACNEVCPVDIPIPDLLLRLRYKGKKEAAVQATKGTPPMGAWSHLASQPLAWKSALRMGYGLNVVPHGLIPIPAVRAWESVRKLPAWRGGKFRAWFKEREKEATFKRSGDE